MLSPRLFSLFNSDSSNSLKHSYIEYTVIALLFINSILIGYLAYKLFILCRTKFKSNFEKKNQRYRIFIFVLILIALILRAIFGADQIYNTLQSDSTSYLEPAVLIIDALPSLIFVSIACAFSYFWHELYSSFEDSEYDHDEKNTKFKTLLITVNATLYFTFIACSILHISENSEAFALVMRSICVLSLIFSTIMLKIHGSRLYHRALKLISCTGRVAKSSGFRTMYIILLICCVLKTIKEGIILYFTATAGEDLLQDLDDIKDGYFLSIFFSYVVVFYLFGEYGMFLSLILLLNSYANKSRVSFGTDNMIKKTQEVYLIDDSDNYAQTAYNSYVAPGHDIENDYISVTFS